MVVQFNYELLLDLMKRDSAILDLSVYTDKTKLNREVRIKAICKCGNNIDKTFRRCYESEMLCHKCTWTNRSIKIENTNLTNWNVRNISQLDRIKQIKEQTSLKNNGVKYYMQSETLREKQQNTMLELYGEKNPMHIEQFKQKQEQIIFDIYGVDNISQLEEIKEKKAQTNLRKRGVRCSMQDPEVQDKNTKSNYRRKEFEMPSGDVRMVQGYEPQALTLLLQSYQEDDIVTGAINVPEIWYTTDNKKHRHYVDIYIKSINTCIEVKSTWTYNMRKEEIHIKQQAAKDLNLKYEIWVMNEKGDILQKIE